MLLFALEGLVHQPVKVLLDLELLLDLLGLVDQLPEDLDLLSHHDHL